MKPTIREAREADIDGIAALFRETYHFHYRSAPEIFASVADTLDMRGLVSGIMANPDAVLLMAVVDEHTVGVSHVRKEAVSPETGFRELSYAKIADLVVTQSLRNRGIGKALIKASEDWAGEQGLTTMQLMVWDFNKPAMDLYESNGFSPVSHIFSKKLN